MQTKQAVKTQFSGLVSHSVCDTAMSSCIHYDTTPTLLDSSPLDPKSWPRSAANIAATFQKAVCFSLTPENTHLLLLPHSYTNVLRLTVRYICTVQNLTEYLKVSQGNVQLENLEFLLISPRIDYYIQCLHAYTQKNGLLSSKDPESGQIDQHSQNKANPSLLFPRRQYWKAFVAPGALGLELPFKL